VLQPTCLDGFLCGREWRWFVATSPVPVSAPSSFVPHMSTGCLMSILIGVGYSSPSGCGWCVCSFSADACAAAHGVLWLPQTLHRPRRRKRRRLFDAKKGATSSCVPHFASAAIASSTAVAAACLLVAAATAAAACCSSELVHLRPVRGPFKTASTTSPCRPIHRCGEPEHEGDCTVTPVRRQHLPRPRLSECVCVFVCVRVFYASVDRLQQDACRSQLVPVDQVCTVLSQTSCATCP
jgi:hypothetical protein